jgi:hypothetical protein
MDTSVMRPEGPMRRNKWPNSTEAVHPPQLTVSDSVSLLHSQQTLSQRPHFSPTCDMANRSGSARFQVLFDYALQAYEKKTGVTLAEHPLTIQLQSCHSVESITTILQDQAQALSDFQGSDRMMKSIKTIVSILTPLSSAAALADAVALVCYNALQR